MGVVILTFSLGSTLVNKAGIPGSTMAFWRMILTTMTWSLILWITDRRIISRAELRRAFVPGVLFGLNIAVFFTAVQRTSVANAEFIGALTPILLIPAGALLFGERLDRKALSFGAVSFAGLAIVLFNAPAAGASSWSGNLLMVLAITLWAGYLLTSRRLRSGDDPMSVQAVMTAFMPIASLAILPLTIARGEIWDVTWSSVPYIVLLAAMTGTIAHGMMVFAQRTVPIGIIGLLQVAQPAIAVMWAYLILDQEVTLAQVGGMALVMIGLTLVVTATRRANARDASAPPLEPSPADA